MGANGFLRMGSDLLVLNSVTMDQGYLLVGAYSLTLDPDAVFVGGSQDSYVRAQSGTVRRQVDSADPGPITFPVGDMNGAWDYAPATIDLYNVVGSGYISLRMIPLPDSNNSLRPRLNRYWILEQNGLTSFNWDGVFTYVDTDVDGDENLLYAAKFSALPAPHWDVSGPADTVNNTLSFTAASGFSEITGTPQFPDQPTAVEMADMAAVSGPGAVSVSWQTAAEAQTSGFRIYRSTSPDGRAHLAERPDPGGGRAGRRSLQLCGLQRPVRSNLLLLD